MKIWFIDGKIDKEGFQLCQNFFLFEELKVVGDNRWILWAIFRYDYRLMVYIIQFEGGERQTLDTMGNNFYTESFLEVNRFFRSSFICYLIVVMNDEFWRVILGFDKISISIGGMWNFGSSIELEEFDIDEFDRLISDYDISLPNGERCYQLFGD